VARLLDELWARIAERYGASEAARQMVDVLCSRESTAPLARNSPFAARWRLARTTDALSRFSPAERAPARRPHH
jgi:hypothetical protein